MPTVDNIEQRLGTGSSAYELDRATLATLYDRNRESPTVLQNLVSFPQYLLDDPAVTGRCGRVSAVGEELRYLRSSMLLSTRPALVHNF